MIKKVRFVILIIVSLVIGLLLTNTILDIIEFDKEPEKDLLYSKIKLQCDENGKFKVMVLADVHAHGKLPDVVLNNIKVLVDKEKPNLIIFTGDNTICSSTIQLQQSLKSMTQYIESLQIPWCHVYGNHDDESGISKEIQQGIYESFKYCISKSSNEELSGVGNYVLPIYKHNSDEVLSLVWCLDSGTYLNSEDAKKSPDVLYPDLVDSPYAYIQKDQIDWYKTTSMKLEQQFGHKIPSLMAFHIPLQETYYAWCQRDSLEEWNGEKNESVAASRFNSGLFDALVERQDVLAVVNGHDHINDYMVKYKGIKLCYSPNVSTLTYHDSYMMGSRIFIFDENNPNDIETYVTHLFR